MVAALAVQTSNYVHPLKLSLSICRYALLERSVNHISLHRLQFVLFGGVGVQVFVSCRWCLSTVARSRVDTRLLRVLKTSFVLVLDEDDPINLR